MAQPLTAINNRQTVPPISGGKVPSPCRALRPTPRLDRSVFIRLPAMTKSGRAPSDWDKTPGNILQLRRGDKNITHNAESTKILSPESVRDEFLMISAIQVRCRGQPDEHRASRRLLAVEVLVRPLKPDDQHGG